MIVWLKIALIEGNKGENVLKLMRSLKNDNIQCKVVVQGTKLSDKFNIKDQVMSILEIYIKGCSLYSFLSQIYVCWA